MTYNDTVKKEEPTVYVHTERINRDQWKWYATQGDSDSVIERSYIPQCYLTREGALLEGLASMRRRVLSTVKVRSGTHMDKIRCNFVDQMRENAHQATALMSEYLATHANEVEKIRLQPLLTTAEEWERGWIEMQTETTGETP